MCSISYFHYKLVCGFAIMKHCGGKKSMYLLAINNKKMLQHDVVRWYCLKKKIINL